MKQKRLGAKAEGPGRTLLPSFPKVRDPQIWILDTDESSPVISVLSDPCFPVCLGNRTAMEEKS